LALCFEDQPLTYSIEKKTVFISARMYSQTITLSEKSVPLETVLKEIQRQTGYKYVFNAQYADDGKKINISVKDATLEEVLDLCFKDQPFTYEIVRRLIVVKEKELAMDAVPVGTPPVDIHGRVTDEKGEPLEGATVTVKGTKMGTATDEKGHFTLANVPDDAVINVVIYL
jgi:hypothetical protein